MAGKLSMDGGNSPAVEEAMREAGDISSAPAESAEVTIGDPVTPQKDDEPEVGEVGERPSRRERRANRYQEAEEARIRAEERAKVLEEELRAARQQQPQPQHYQPPSQQQGPDPIEQAAARLRQEHEDLVNTYNAKVQAGSLTAEEAAQFRERGWKLTEKREELAAVRVLHKTGKLAPQPQGLTQQDLLNMQLSTQYPEVYADPKLVKRAQLKFDELLLDGEPDSAATTAKALAYVRDQYGPTQRPAPDQGMKQRLTAVGAGARPGAGGRQQAPTLKMDKDMIKMAVKTYSHLPREQAIQKWANEVGPGFLEDVRGSGR